MSRKWTAGTFQGENPLSQCIHDILQRRLIGHVEEVLLIRVASYELDFLQEGFRVDSSTVIIAQNLEEPQSIRTREFQVKSQSLEGKRRFQESGKQ